MSERNTRVVERFYHELWNRWNLDTADEILAEDLRFRGTLGSVLEGREDFKGYVETVRCAFPDWHNRIDEVISCGDGRVVTRMTWSGTHEGRLADVGPTGARVEYVGAAIFRISAGRIEEGVGGRGHPRAVEGPGQALAAEPAAGEIAGAATRRELAWRYVPSRRRPQHHDGHEGPQLLAVGPRRLA
jgi:predicted ester cyclase